LHPITHAISSLQYELASETLDWACVHLFGAARSLR
jgi:hypothetical protein